VPAPRGHSRACARPTAEGRRSSNERRRGRSRPQTRCLPARALPGSACQPSALPDDERELLGHGVMELTGEPPAFLLHGTLALTLSRAFELQGCCDRQRERACGAQRSDTRRSSDCCLRVASSCSRQGALRGRRRLCPAAHHLKPLLGRQKTGHRASTRHSARLGITSIRFIPGAKAPPTLAIAVVDMHATSRAEGRRGRARRCPPAESSPRLTSLTSSTG
jgi:hypothetical protein